MWQDMAPAGHGSFLERRVRSVFPELPWLPKGQALLGPYFRVASPGWRRGSSCGPDRPPPLHESPAPQAPSFALSSPHLSQSSPPQQARAVAALGHCPPAPVWAELTLEEARIEAPQ